jgi:hypothetical protein
MAALFVHRLLGAGEAAADFDELVQHRLSVRLVLLQKSRAGVRDAIELLIALG